MAFRLELPDIDNAYEMADWFEMMMLAKNYNFFSRAQLSEKLVAEIGSTPQELECPINF